MTPPLRAAVEAMSRDLETIVGRVARIERLAAVIWRIGNEPLAPAEREQLEALGTLLIAEIVSLGEVHNLEP
jgi:hypothetical protein